MSVEISNKGDQMVVGRQSEIVCRSSGSRPPAHITWYLGGVRIEGGTESVSLLFWIIWGMMKKWKHFLQGVMKTPACKCVLMLIFLQGVPQEPTGIEWSLNHPQMICP